MAIKPISQLKSWFRHGAYPTGEQFADWLDSFFHKGEKIPIDNFEGLPETINGKYDAAAGEDLERRQNETDNTLGTMWDAIYAGASDISANSARIAELQGRGGSIPANDFVTETPTQQALTQYAAQAIWGTGGLFTWNASDPAASTYVATGGITRKASEIFNSTWVRNSNNNHRWVLTNTQDTNPAIFEWTDVGTDTTSVATSTTAGIVMSDAPGGEFVVDSATGKTTITEYATSPSAISENVTKFAADTKKSLKSWMGDVWSKINGIIQQLNTSKTVGGQSIWGTGDIPLSSVKIVTIANFNSFNPTTLGLAGGESCGFTHYSTGTTYGRPFMSSSAGSSDPLSSIYYWAGTITRINGNYYMLTAYGQMGAGANTPHMATRVYNGSSYYDWHVSTDYSYKSTNGYVKLPSGIMIQWGYISSTSQNISVVFSVSFVEIFNVIASIESGPTDAGVQSAMPYDKTVSRCSFRRRWVAATSSGDSTAPFFWQAIGTWK